MNRRTFSLLVPLVLFTSAACGDGGNTVSPAKWSHAYEGKLTLTYTRDFPAFTATVSIAVNISKAGVVTMGSAAPASYMGDEVKMVNGGQFRQSEKGTVTATPAGGVTILRGTKEFVALDVKSKIVGEQITYVWDDQKMTWVVGATAPFDLDDPIKPPLEFDVADATISQTGAQIGSTVPQAFGTVTYKWVLGLVVIP